MEQSVSEHPVRGLARWALVAALFVGCTNSKKTDSNSDVSKAEEGAPAAALSPDQQKAFDEYKAELEIGRNMAGRLLAFYGLVDNRKLVDYLNQVATYVAKAGNYPDRRYMVAVLDSDTVNAFACPGGYILITRGTLMHAKNEAELAAVLGHETAHVGLQHMFKTLSKMSKDEADKLEAESQARKPKDQWAATRRRPKPEDNVMGSAVAKLLTTASGAGLGVLQAAQAGMSLILEKGLDQKLEYEADQEGVIYAVRAGYEPKALDDFLARLDAEKQAQKKKQKTVLDKTHPPIADRRKAIANALAKMDVSKITGATLEKRFVQYQQLAVKKKG